MNVDPSQFTSAYGPYAFGVMAFIAIVSVLVVAWRVVFVPALKQLTEISVSHANTAQSQATTAQAMQRTTEAAERIMASCTCRHAENPRATSSDSR